LNTDKINLARAAAICALALSIISLGLGISGVREPMRFRVLYPMRHTAAMGVGTLAIAIIAILRGDRRLARWTASIGTAISVLALSAQFYRWTSIDESQRTTFGTVAALVNTAFPNTISLFVAGTALLVLAGRRESVNRLVWASVAGSVTLTLGLCSFLNEITDLLPANPGFEGEIAVDAALSFALVGWAMVRMARSRAAATGEAMQLHRPILVAVLGTMAAFVTWRSLLQERSSVVAYQTSTAARAAARALRTELGRRLHEVSYSAWETGPSLLEETGLPSAREIVWTDAPHLLANSDPAMTKLKQAAGSTSGPFYDVVAGSDGEAKLAFVSPRRGASTRVAILPLRVVADPMMANVVGGNFQVVLVRNGKPIYQYPNPARPNEEMGQAEVPLDEINAVFRLRPRSQYVRRGGSWASNMVLAIGLNTSFLLAFSAYLLHVARTRLEQLQEIRSGLEREVAQRREAQVELARKAKQLETSNSDLREFAHVASHDLQEPLRSISGFAQIVSRRYKGRIDSDADEFLDYITESSNRMTGMVQGLLAYSRVVHSTDLDEPVPLAGAIEFAKSNLLLAVEEAQATIIVSDLPTVRGNKLQFCQLMQNLLGNALKYRGTNPLVVTVSCELENGEQVVTVADNGIGVGPEYQERIFGLFKRAHGREYPGAGVGLALCKKIVEKHGGRIWVESQPGEGARFRFSLPT